MDSVVLASWVRHAGTGVATLLFVVGLLMQRRVPAARDGNRLSALGMLLAVVLALVEMGAFDPAFVGAGIVLGVAIGLVAAQRVRMTAMPQMVALFNGMGGGASMLVALACFHELAAAGGLADRTLATAMGTDGALSTVLSVGIGAITLTGSVVAFLKLQSWIPGRPILLPHRHLLHGAMAVAVVVLGGLAAFGVADPGAATVANWAFAAAALALGVLLVLPIGGADMPVVISLLNSYSGLAAAMTGFVLKNVLLVVVGSLVGASGIVLTRIMSRAMNRSLASVLLGGVGGTQGVAAPPVGPDPGAVPDAAPSGAVAKTVPDAPRAVADPAVAARRLQEAARVVVVPGYGMALARAQFDVVRLARFLERLGKEVRFAVHPVAGRMPGHMNVLLAEADVDYEKLVELDEANRRFPSTDVVLVVGACDVVNPAANDPSRDTPLSGMPILEVSQARSVVVCNLDDRPGYSGVGNPLYRNARTLALFGDALGRVREIRRALGDLEGTEEAAPAEAVAGEAQGIHAGAGG